MARIRSKRSRFLASIANELASQSNRVRDLIGSRHWLSDGHHKEFLLRTLVRRHLPSGTLACRGFVISPVEPELCSNEQDILIVDTTREAPVFYQGGLAVCFPRTLLGTISVKTRSDRKEVLDSIKGLNSVRDVARDSADSRAIWCGAYFFEAGDAITATPAAAFAIIRDGLANYPALPPAVPPPQPPPVGPDLFCAGADLIYRLDHGVMKDQQLASPAARLRGFRCLGLASALFVADLLDHVAVRRGLPEADFADFAGVPDLEVVNPDAE